MISVLVIGGPFDDGTSLGLGKKSSPRPRQPISRTKTKPDPTKPRQDQD